MNKNRKLTSLIIFIEFMNDKIKVMVCALFMFKIRLIRTRFGDRRETFAWNVVSRVVPHRFRVGELWIPFLLSKSVCQENELDEPLFVTMWNGRVSWWGSAFACGWGEGSICKSCESGLTRRWSRISCFRYAANSVLLVIAINYEQFGIATYNFP